MDEGVSNIITKLKQLSAVMQIIKIEASRENLQCMLACLNTIDEIEEDLIGLRKVKSAKEADLSESND